MIHFKNHNPGFTLLETIIAVTVAAFIFLPIYMLQGTLLARIGDFSFRIQRLLSAEQYMYESRREQRKELPYSVDKKIDQPPTTLRYEQKVVPEKSSLGNVKQLVSERVTIQWDIGRRVQSDTIVHFLYKPETP